MSGGRSFHDRRAWLWAPEALICLALATTSWYRLGTEGLDSTGFSASATLLIAAISAATGIAGVLASWHERPLWAALALFVSTNTSLSPVGVLHLLGGGFVLAEIVRAVARRHGRPGAT